MKVRNLFFKIFAAFSLFAFFSCTNLIEELKKFVVDTQVITAAELELDSISSVSAGDNLIVETSLDNDKIVLKSVGYGQTSVVVKGKAYGQDVTEVLTVKVSKEGSIVSWITERIVGGKKIVTENSSKTDLNGTKDLTTTETVTDIATGTVEKTTETVSKTKSDGSSEVVEQIKEGDTTTIITTVLDKDGKGTEITETVDKDGNKTLVSEKEVNDGDDSFTETTVEKSPEDLNLPPVTSVKDITVDSPDVAEVEFKDGKIKVKSKTAGKTKVTVTDADNKTIVLIIIVAADGTVTITPEENGDDSFTETTVEKSPEDLNLPPITSVKDITVDSPDVAEVEFKDGKIKVKSKTAGKTKVTVTDADNKPIILIIVVAADGTVTITPEENEKVSVDVNVDYGINDYKTPQKSAVNVTVDYGHNNYSTPQS